MRDCVTCGAELPWDAPSGLCPECLVRAGFDSDDQLQPSAAAHGLPPDSVPESPGSQLRFQPPLPEELEASFPQLEILELLGHGGMGAVYKARQTKLDRYVALKIIRPESAGDPAFAERFSREARTLARLNHPNIVAVHDFGEVDVSDSVGDAAASTLYYFLMEYVDGANLRQLIQDGELTSDETLSIIPQICEALQFAHDQGVVHRDVKPENILVNTSGRVKIADFGLARLVTATSQDFTLTGSHQVMGTPRYMAPEQMAGSHDVDHRVDIYSLGVVFYEMLTGELPMGRCEPPSRCAPWDRRLEKVILRAMAHEPDQRFQQAKEVKSRVEEISSHSAPTSFAGVSTMMEREGHNAWRWIAGDFDRAAKRAPTLPALLMILMSISGGLMILLPRMDLGIDKQTTMLGVDIELKQDVSQTFDGYELWSGIASAVTFGCLGLLLTITPTHEVLSVKRSVAMTGLATLALLLTFLFRMELESRTYPATLSTDADPLRLTTSVRNVEHRIVYRSGFCGSLGMSVGLLLLSACGVRHAIRGRHHVRPNRSRVIHPPLTSIRFSVGAAEEIGSQVVFHFVGLGYRLVDDQPNAWVFERGNTWDAICLAGLWSTDIRALPTRLTVNAVSVNGDKMLINCVWAVRTLGTWIGRRDIRKLEAEGHDLNALLTEKG